MHASLSFSLSPLSLCLLVNLNHYNGYIYLFDLVFWPVYKLAKLGSFCSITLHSQNIFLTYKHTITHTLSYYFILLTLLSPAAVYQAPLHRFTSPPIQFIYLNTS